MARSELAQRVAVAAVGIPVVIVAAYVGGWVLGALLTVAAVLGALEFYRLAEAKGERPLRAAGAIGAAGMVLIASATPRLSVAGPRLFLLLTLLTIALLALVIWRRGPTGRPLAAVTTTLTGVVYTAGTLTFAIFLRHLYEAQLAMVNALLGVAVLLCPLILTWLNDTFAYFGGRAWGKTKLIPSVSPGKTVAGAVVALVGTIGAGIVYAVFVLDRGMGLPLGAAGGAALGALVSVGAQVGDLAESLLKREAGVKDSGHLLPGHGGVLDRLDALYFTIPLAYWFLSSLYGGTVS